MTRGTHSTLTTGEAARLCEVASRTVVHWCDREGLPSHRLPGSRDRRIRRADLADFLRACGIPPPDGLLANRGSVLLVGLSADDAAAVVAALPTAEFRAASTAFDAGILAERHRPAAVVVDSSLGRIEAATVRLAGAATIGYGDAGLKTSVEKRPAALAEYLGGLTGRKGV